MNTHTPGPWNVSGDGVRVTAKPFTFLPSCYGEGAPEAEWQANARLIAAAPDLLAALKGWIAFCDKLEGKPATMTSAAYMDVLRDIARAAIAKAEGTS